MSALTNFQVNDCNSFWSRQCYIPSFMKIGQPVLEKKIFEGFFTIYGRGGHLGHVTQMPQTKYRSPYPKRLHLKFGFDRPSAFGEERRRRSLQDHNLCKLRWAGVPNATYQVTWNSAHRFPRKILLTFNTFISSYSQLDVCSYLHSGQWLK